MHFRSKSRRRDREYLADQGQQTFDTLSIRRHRKDNAYEMLHEALEELPEIYRQVLTLYYLGGMKSREIAQFLGTSVTNINARLSRARSLLKEEMITMMSTTFDEMRLQPGFTFRMVEAIKQTKIQAPPSKMTLPFSVSAAAGLIVLLLSLSIPDNRLYPIGELIGSPLPSQMRMIEDGMIPVDAIEITTPMSLSSQMSDGDFGKKPLPKPMRMSAAFELQETLTEKDGLAGNTVTAIFEDSKGNLWFGTTNGVSRYDGKNFVNFTEKDGLAADVVGAIFEDSNKNLWFGTGKWDIKGGGVSRYDGKNFVNFTEKDGLAGNTVLDIFQDRAGNLWFGTVFGGVSRYDGSTFHNITSGFARNADWNLDGSVNAIAQDEAGNLWFGCYGGISRYDGKKLENFTTDDGLFSGWIIGLYFDKKGHLWIARAGGGDSGLSRYDGKTFTNFPNSEGLPSSITHSIMQSRQGELWFGTIDGVSTYNGTSFQSYGINQGLPSAGLGEKIEKKNGVHMHHGKGVVSILEDSNGTFWFATLGGGVSLGVKPK